jgi:hypothetical protein
MAASSIFRSAPVASRPASRLAPPDVPRGDGVVVEPRPLVIGKLAVAPRHTPPAPATLDAQLTAILDTPLAPGETVMTGFDRKERELGGLLATLSVADCRALHARLQRSSDPLARTFARLTSDRRIRLMNFLADARRREAISAARR